MTMTLATSGQAHVQGNGLLAGEFTARTTRRRHSAGRISVRQMARAVADWWADDSMSSRFAHESARDERMLRRHSRP